MKTIPKIGSFFAIALVLLPRGGREIGSLDITLLAPKPMRLKIAGGGGTVGGIGGNGIAGEPTLKFISRPLVNRGPNFYEIKIVNVSGRNQDVPWDPNGSDFEPGESVNSFVIRTVAVSLQATCGERVMAATSVELYGSSTVQGSVVTLHPGDWVRLTVNAPKFTGSCEGLSDGNLRPHAEVSSQEFVRKLDGWFVTTHPVPMTLSFEAAGGALKR
jgi:hypothetical protein